MRSLLFWLFFYSPVDSVTLPDPRCSFTVCVWAKVAVLKVRAGNYVFANIFNPTRNITSLCFIRAGLLQKSDRLSRCV